MMTTTRHPLLYQVNTRVWLTELSRSLGRPATLDDVPDAALDRMADLGFDWVRFLSVWRTGIAGQRVTRARPSYFTVSIRSGYTFTSLCDKTANSMRGQIRSSHATKSRPLMFPTRRWTTRGGGKPSTMRREKSASLVTIAKSFCWACSQSSESLGREPSSKAWVTDRRVGKEGTRGRFSSKRKPLMPHVRPSIGCPLAGPHDLHMRAPAPAEVRETHPAHPPPNPPPPASPVWTERRSASRAAQAAHCTHRDESQSSPNSRGNTTPNPGCRQGQFLPARKDLALQL